jgi:hypothetical protein
MGMQKSPDKSGGAQPVHRKTEALLLRRKRL